MSTFKDLQILSDAAYYDRCNYVNYNVDNVLKETDKMKDCIYHARAGTGEIPLFKILMTNQCNNDCAYCTNCRSHNYQRARLSPDALARIFMQYYENGMVEGLFLSSGIIKDADTTMEEMIEAAHLLRNKYSYNGYIHLKIIPGTSKDHIKHAMQLADRVSINIEAATKDGLSDISSTKNYDKDILKRLDWIDNLHRRDHNLASSGHTTQIIVGANDETDEDILKQVYKLTTKYDVLYNYFSTFKPLEGTPLENHDVSDSRRTGRLYQAEYLFNQYNFTQKDIILGEDGFLDLNNDPKYSIALAHKEDYSIDVNTAKYKELIRVPGIGLKSARRITHLQKIGHEIKSLKELQEIGANINKCKIFVKVGGTYQSTLI
ncbi:radical SAM protein [Methanosphaera sp. WGK6]|uniref:radical SAM protein n=1 Tax=Methanosphaera sp. WGK6 TaxID=1561964 RepID=UPI00084BE2E5|nr:radical SAM protein [Methanosphaera sp. WGK6]OED30782.1 radical SAM protein [Methanosphaera sp. WGK6]